ncbi:MAG: EamA family transporter [Deltaproteobacteria bacterium]|nr:EamA family transporter [Deltaproteobacteria bacterium]
MNGTALVIVLASAFLHAGWNYLLKKSDRKIVFIWWFLLASLVLYLPLFLYFYADAPIPSAGWLCIVATGLIHAAYFWFIGGAYQRGDLSLVYPLARGSGPLFVPILAVILLREEIAPLGGFGIGLVVAGIYCVHLRSFNGGAVLEPFRALHIGASLWALSTGLMIAAYSLVDKVGVGLVYPPVYIYIMNVISWLALTPWILIRERDRLREEWQRHAGTIFVVGFFSVFTYLMILFALTMSKVSYVAAVREVSIVLSAYFGVFYLREKQGKQKLLGAVMITLGVVAIGLSR